MEIHSANPATPQKVNFPNGRSAHLLNVDGEANAQEILGTFGIHPPQAVVIISGGAGNMEKSKLRRLAPFFSFGIARAAKKRNALIIDGGTQAGVMELMGRGVADQGNETDLIGVAPSGRTTFPGASEVENVQDRANLDPNHSHFVLVTGNNWGDETALMYNLAETLYQGNFGKAKTERGEKKVPTVTVLAGGRVGGIAMREAQATVRKGWPLVVMEGSGQLADEIASRYRSHRLQNNFRSRLSRFGLQIRRWLRPDLQEADAFINEIVEDGQIILFSLNSKPSELKTLLVNQLKEKPVDSILLRAWKRFAVYDQNAARHQITYRFLKTWPLILGVLITALVLLNEFLTNPPVTDPPMPPPFNNPVIKLGDPWYWILHGLIILTPIIVTLFLAADRLFKSGNKWLLLRYYAEEIKKDIYSYRVLAAIEHRQETNLPDKATELSRRLTQIGQRLMRTEVNESALTPYSGPIPPRMYGAAAKDDGLSPLDIETYINIRINDQLSFYSLKANKLEKQLKPRQWFILGFGALGSLLAALGGIFQFWVPLSVAFVSALTAYLEYQQVEQTIVKYNQAMTKLANLADGWVALSPIEKKTPKNIVQLIEEAEQVMQSEHLGWVQQMQTSQTDSGKAEVPPSKNESDSDHKLKVEENAGAVIMEQQDSPTTPAD
jgi:hypothetical protein